MTLSFEEQLEMQQVGESIDDSQMAEVLEELAQRELMLLDGDLGQGEMREITIHNATCLAAAAARLRSFDRDTRELELKLEELSGKPGEQPGE